MKQTTLILLMGLGTAMVQPPHLAATIALKNFQDLREQEWSVYLPAREEDPKKELLNEAVAAYQRGDFGTSEKILNTLLMEDGENPDYYHYMGLIYFRKNNFVYADIYFSESLKLNPTDHLSRYNRAVVYYHLKQYKNAVEDCGLILQEHPDYLPAYNTRGLCHKHLGENELALGDYSEVVKCDPENFTARFNRALLLHGQQKFSDAITDLNYLLEKKGDERTEKLDVLLYFRGLCYSQSGETEKAREDLKLVGAMNSPYSLDALQRLEGLTEIHPEGMGKNN